MKKIEVYISDELHEYYKLYAGEKDRSLSSLVRHALKRLTTTNPVKGLERPGNNKMSYGTGKPETTARDELLAITRGL